MAWLESFVAALVVFAIWFGYNAARDWRAIDRRRSNRENRRRRKP